MDIGVLIDTFVFMGLGIYLIYISKAKKETLGNKAKWIKLGGIIVVLSKVLGIIFFRK